MLSFKHVSRFLGEQAARRPVLPLTANQDLQLMRFPGLGARSLGTGPFTGVQYRAGSFGVYAFDPPVGGFVIGETILSLPEQDPTLTIGAAVTPTFLIAYPPGVYDFELRWAAPAAFASSMHLALSILNNVAGATDLGSGLPGIFGRLFGTGIGNVDTPFPRFRFLALNPWKAFLSVTGATITDTILFQVRICAQPVVLFDEAGNVLS